MKGILTKLNSLKYWLPSYLTSKSSRVKNSQYPIHIFFCITDHFEPFWNKVDYKTAYSRVKRWVEEYPKIVEKHKDSDGRHPVHCFFYPEEEYNKELLTMLASLCHQGFGETDIHLHHDNDTSDNLRQTLLDFKSRLANEHGLLARDRQDGRIRYGFIHGNWALDNSRPDGKWCGVNDEITILQETGCYADFTMPSAPSDTQTKKINSIYYAIDDPAKSKSHDTGKDAEAGKRDNQGLLMIQGPLCLNWQSRKLGIFPRIENSGLTYNNPPSKERVDLWVKQNICVKAKPEWIFVKLYTHGAQEQSMKMFFEEGWFDRLFDFLEENYNDGKKYKLHYVSAREMYNIVKSVEAGDCSIFKTIGLYDRFLEKA